MEYLALAVNLVPTPAPTQLTNYNFNSLAKFNGRYIGAGENGLMVLGESANDDNGTNISAFFTLLKSDFGMPNQKRIERLYFGYEADGVIKATMVPDDSSDPWVYYLDPINGENKQEGNTIPGNRRYKGRYWSIKVENVNGSDFSIDSINVLITRLGKKPSGSRL